MGAGSKVARKFWLQNLCREMRQQIDIRNVARLPALRADGVTLGEVAQYLGSHGLLCRQHGDENAPVYVARSLENLGIAQDVDG